MKFTLTIDCGNAAFCPAHDDASEAERFRAVMSEVRRILRTKEWTAVHERSGRLVDANGNRCGSWSLNSDDEGSNHA